MITQTNPQIEDRLATPTIQREPDVRPEHMSLTPQETIGGMQTPNIALAGLQLIVGYEWLVSGVDKLLFGVFPASLGRMLMASVSGGQLPGFFAAILRGLVMPNAVFFGYLIEWSETLGGLALVIAGLVALLSPLSRRYLRGKGAAIFMYGVLLLKRLAPLAAIGMGLLGLSFFFLDGLPKPWFIPSIAYGGAIDTGLFLAAASVVLVVGQLMQRSK